MYGNIGKKLKISATVTLILRIIAVIILGVISFSMQDGEYFLVGVGTIVIGIPLAFIPSWRMYGLGKLIEKVYEIEQNISNGKVKNQIKKGPDFKKIDNLEKLRSQGLISEEEYQQALSKK